MQFISISITFTRTLFSLQLYFKLKNGTLERGPFLFYPNRCLELNTPKRVETLFIQERLKNIKIHKCNILI